MMERRDEEQIIKELLGGVDDTWVYFIIRGGKEIPVLSYVGIKECMRQYGHIRMTDLLIVETDKGFRATVKAVDDITHCEMFGVSAAAYDMDTSRGSKIDEFALQKAVSKAQRNAGRAVLPENVIAKIVGAYVQKKKMLRAPKRDSKRLPTQSDTQKNAVDGKFRDAKSIDADMEPQEPMATEKQVNYINRLLETVPSENLGKLYRKWEIKNLGELTIEKASDIIQELELIKNAKLEGGKQ